VFCIVKLNKIAILRLIKISEMADENTYSTPEEEIMTLEEAETMISANVRTEADKTMQAEPELSSLLDDVVISRDDLFDVIIARIARKIGRYSMSEEQIIKIFREVVWADADTRAKILADLLAIKDRDPACTSYLHAILFYKGFQSVTCHRIAHKLWAEGRKQLAFYLQSLTSEIFGVDIHPAARFGGGILLDHATSFVAGETSVVEDNVSILHEVTLGGTGKESGDRHPKVKSGVLIGAGAKLIGNITIGRCAKIGAGSVVLDDVAPHTTVVGIPARPIGVASEDEPAIEMNQMFKRQIGVPNCGKNRIVIASVADKARDRCL